jgi:hypothetical protein
MSLGQRAEDQRDDGDVEKAMGDAGHGLRPRGRIGDLG